MTPSPTDRRAALRAAALGLLGGFATPARLRAAPDGPPGFGRAKSCILVYLLGGPAHQDTFDLKPGAPVEVRGPFRPVATTVPGIRVCEHLPRLAAQAHRMAVVRSVSYPNHDHPFMIYYTLTGRVSPAPLGENTVLPPSRTDYPHFGSVVAKFKHRDDRVPGYVAIPEVRVRMQAVPVSGGGRAGFLGPAFDPFPVNDDPAAVTALRRPPEVPAARLDGRAALLAALEGCRNGAKAADEHEAFRRSGVRLLRADGGRDPFDLDREPPAVRDRYGRHRFGQSLLLARRLTEAGVSVAAVHFNFMSKCDGWDTHAKNFECLQGELLPLLDQGLSALIDDLADRGRLGETLVVCMGEFGRTPKVNANGGRDHWGHCASVVLAGGGVCSGRLVGASDAIAAYPRELPLDPADIQATVYHCLGLHPEEEMRDQFGRPLPLSVGRVVSQLF